MRPEIREYNYDWLMGSTLNAASKVPNGSPKETELTYRYIPSYKDVVKSFVDVGEPGLQIFNLFAKYYENILTAREQGKKLMATTFCFSPSILYAMDIVPICMEMLTALGNIVWQRGMYEYLDYACQIGLPETSCSSQRGAMGPYMAGLGENIDFVLNNMAGSCDTNVNAFSFLASYLDKPFFQMNTPSTIGDQRSEKYHLDDYKAMVGFLEEQTGNKLDYDRLAEILTEVDKQDALITDIEDMHTLRPTPLSPIHNLGLYVGRYTFSGRKEYTRLLEAIYETAKNRAKAGVSGLKSGEEKLRILMIYIDHYNLGMNYWKWFDDNGIAHMGSHLSHHFRDTIDYTLELPGSSYGIDTSSPESMLNSIAQMNARNPMVRSIRGPYDGPSMWLEENLALGKHFSVDCMVFNGTPGCRNTWSNNKLIARDLEKQGYPVHIMNDDAFDDRMESWETTKERLEEFLQVRGLL